MFPDITMLNEGREYTDEDPVTAALFNFLIQALKYLKEGDTNG